MFGKADILDTSKAEEIVAEQVKIVKMKFSAVGSEPFEWKPDQKDLSDANDPALTDKDKYAIATAIIDIKHDKALSRILELIKPIDFKAIVYAKEKAKLSTDDYDKLKVSYTKLQIVIIDVMQEVALKNQYSLCYNNEPEIDKRKVLINLQNGTFEINNGETKKRDFNPKDFLTYQLPFSYDPAATAPIFQKYLDKVLPDAEKQKVVAEYLGYVFIRHGSNVLKEERTLILYGSGANGKSVLFEVVRSLLGTENISSYSLESLTDANGYFRAMIDTKLLNYASEISSRMDPDRFKNLVSGEPIEARHPAGRAMQIEQYAKLMFNCNALPKAKGDLTNAFFRRFLIVPFDVTIPEAEQNKNLHTEIIESELAGVFNWILAGLKRLLDQKRFSKCTASDEALKNYKIESDTISLWMAEDGYSIAENKKQFSEAKQLYYEYTNYCDLSGFKALDKIAFGNNLQQLKVLKASGSGNKLMYGITKFYAEKVNLL